MFLPEKTRRANTIKELNLKIAKEDRLLKSLIDQTNRVSEDVKQLHANNVRKESSLSKAESYYNTRKRRFFIASVCYLVLPTLIYFVFKFA